MATRILTRQQLYDRAWTTPIDSLARELGLSGRGLGKLCARYSIPVPPRGYWAKKIFGKRVTKPSLPLPDTYGEKIHFNAPERVESAEPQKVEIDPLIVSEGLESQRITVPTDLPLTDALVLTTQRRLTRTKREPNGLIALPERALPVHTSRALHERALRIMQALLTAFAARGFPVAMTNEGTRVKILDESIAFEITESTNTVSHRVSFTEQKLIDRGAGSQVPKTDLVPAGTLSLVITNVKYVRQRWAETSSKPLESLLNKFLAGLVNAALGLKKQRADAERQERERQEAERRRQEEARRREEAERRWREEQTKVERLDRFAAVWRRNQELRRLIADVKAAMGEVDASSELGRWLAWAIDHAEQSDPMRRFRNRSGQKLTLYYDGYDHDEVPGQGFSEPKFTDYGNQKTKPGIKLSEQPPQHLYYSHGLKLELPEDVVLPYEWVQESDWHWRVFRVPAVVLNRTLGYGPPREDGSERDREDDEESDTEEE